MNFKNYISRISEKKFIYLTRAESKAVIVDESASDYLVTLLPPEIDPLIIPIRTDVRYWSWKTFFFLVLQIPLLASRRINIRGSYVLGVCRSVNCRLILSYIDNNNWDKGLAATKHVRVALLQNGCRPNTAYNGKIYDILFGFPRIRPKAIVVKEYEGIGNIKMYLAQHRNKTVDKPKRAVVFVSQYRPHSTPYESMCSCQVQLAQWASLYAHQSELEFTIALNGRRGDWLLEEKSIYEDSLSHPVRYVHRSENLLASYELIIGASLVIGHSSSLLVESIAMGLRTLICWNVCYEEEIDTLREFYNTPEMEEFTLGERKCFQRFEEKADNLINTTEEDFRIAVERIRASYCEYKNGEGVLDSIRCKLAKMCCQ